MEIYLVRHTTPAIEKGICYGQSDLDLADTWEQEFESIKSKLPLTQATRIFSSPLKRCAILAQNLGKTISFDDKLMELNFGDWELKAWNHIPKEDLNPWMEDFVNVQVPNGESYTQLATRVYAAFKTITTSMESENLIIVTHASPIRALLSKFANKPLIDSFKIKIGYGDVFHITKENNTYHLKTAINP